MFICIRLRKRQQCCEPKNGGETKVTNKLLSELSMDQFQYRQCVKEVLCNISPMDSFHLLLGWAWLHFKILNPYKRSL